MRFYLIIILFLLSSCSHLQRNPGSLASDKGRIRHVVLDIDWTIVSEVAQEKKGPRIIEIEGKKYFIHEGLEDLIESLLQRGDVKVSYFSGGGFARNHALLKAIKLSDGRSLEETAYKILNREDLVSVAEALPTDKFSARYKKDLTRINQDLTELIMIDDTEHFVANAKQEEHVLWTGQTFTHFDYFKEATSATGDYIPRTESEWLFARKKLLIIQGAIEDALKESDQTGISFSGAMKLQAKELDLGSGDWNNYSRKMYQKALDKNWRAMKSMQHSNHCVQLFSTFLSEQN